MTSPLDLASLLAARLCHDVVGPVGAIQNGLELMADDDGMTDMAMDLIASSAAQAAAKLQYARMAYGLAGGVEVLEPSEAGKLVGRLYDWERSDLDWAWTGPAAPIGHVRLAMLMTMYVLGAVPRGGQVTVAYADANLCVSATGEKLRTPAYLDIATGGGATNDPHAAPALLMAHLAAASGWQLNAHHGDGTFTLCTEPA